MTQAEKIDVRLMLDFAPVNSKLESLKNLYLNAFHRLSDIDRFIENVGGIDNAVEVLGIYDSQR